LSASHRFMAARLRSSISSGVNDPLPGPDDKREPGHLALARRPGPPSSHLAAGLLPLAPAPGDPVAGAVVPWGLTVPWIEAF
jgi:hypothetical protein